MIDRATLALPKVVFSTTLTAVQGNASLAAGCLADEITRLCDERAGCAFAGATAVDNSVPYSSLTGSILTASWQVAPIGIRWWFSVPRWR